MDLHKRGVKLLLTGPQMLPSNQLSVDAVQVTTRVTCGQDKRLDYTIRYKNNNILYQILFQMGKK